MKLNYIEIHVRNDETYQSKRQSDWEKDIVKKFTHPCLISQQLDLKQNYVQKITYGFDLILQRNLQRNDWMITFPFLKQLANDNSIIQMNQRYIRYQGESFGLL